MSLAERESETFKFGTQERENRVSSDKQSRLIAIIWTSRVEPINRDFFACPASTINGLTD